VSLHSMNMIMIISPTHTTQILQYKSQTVLEHTCSKLFSCNLVERAYMNVTQYMYINSES